MLVSTIMTMTELECKQQEEIIELLAELVAADAENKRLKQQYMQFVKDSKKTACDACVGTED